MEALAWTVGIVLAAFLLGAVLEPFLAGLAWRIPVRPALLMGLLAGGAGLALAWLGWIRHANLRSGLDVATFEQILWNTLYVRPFECSFFGCNYLGHHFIPSIGLLTPFYALYQHPATLLLLQGAALGGAAFFLYALVNRNLGRSWLGIAFGTAFLLSPVTHRASLFDFHQDAFIPLLLLLTLLARGKWYWLAFPILLGLKEDQFLFLWPLVFFQIFQGHRRRALLTLVVLLAWGPVVFHGIMPAFHCPLETDLFRERFGYLGESFGEVSANPLRLLQGLWTTALEGENWIRLAYLAGGWAFLPFLGWRAAVWWLTPAFLNLLSINVLQHTLTVHYGLVVWTFMAVGSIQALASLQRENAVWNRIFAGLGWAVLVVNLTLTWQFGELPLRPGNFGKLVVSARAEGARKLLGTLPPEAAVSATDPILSHVARREHLYPYPLLDPEKVGAEYLVLDLTLPWYDSSEKTQEDLARIQQNPHWKVLRYEFDVLVLGRIRNP